MPAKGYRADRGKAAADQVLRLIIRRALRTRVESIVRDEFPRNYDIPLAWKCYHLHEKLAQYDV